MPSLFDKLKGKTTREESPHDNRVGGLAGPSQVLDPGRPNTQRDTVKRYGFSETGPAPATATVDVVCVHGLMGHPRETWTENGENFFWPAHVNEDLPHIRVFTYGYDADPANLFGQVNQSRLGEHAQDLLNDMARMREKTDTEGRPIIWVAHSLGGLVVEKALTIGDTSSRNDKRLKIISDKTIGLITLGTPHAGSDLAAWAEITSRLIRSVHVNKNIVKSLTADSEVLRDTNNAFARLLETRKERSCKIDVQPFHETAPISNVGMVVSIASASIFGYQSEGIRGNHMEITKFSSREDSNYDKVIGTIRRWQREWQSSIDEEQQKVLQACLESLSYDEIKAYHDHSRSLLGASVTKFHHRQTAAHAGTFDWIFEETSLGFEAWLLKPCGPYWIQGKPGSGKTTLVRHIVSSARLATIAIDMEVAVAVHYFQADSSSLARSVEGMLRSLLWQLMQQVPSPAISTVLKRHAEIQKLGRDRGTWSNEELEVSLTEVIALFPEAAVCLFVDGLDEHEGEDIEITNYLAKLQCHLPCNARLCVSSRPNPDFAAQFGTSVGFKMHEYTSHDIEQYVRHRCEDLRAFQPSREQQMSTDIISKAQGSFLWTRLVCDDLQKDWRRHRSPEALEERLKITPKDLMPFYQRILDELDQEETKELYHMLSILTESNVPLTSIELLYAMEDDRNLENLRHAQREDWTSFDRVIRTAIWDDRNFIETPVDWIQSVNHKNWVSYMYAMMFMTLHQEDSSRFNISLRIAMMESSINDEMVRELPPDKFEALTRTAVRSGEMPETTFDGAHMVEGRWLAEWRRQLWRDDKRSKNDAGLIEDDKRCNGYGPKPTEILNIPGFLNSVARSSYGATEFRHAIQSWCDNRVELIGRGFLTLDHTTGEFHMAHETMLEFWQNASIDLSQGKGHESLLIAHASSLVAIGRRYPAALKIRYARALREDAAIPSSHAGHTFEHVFQRLALAKSSPPLRRYGPFDLDPGTDRFGISADILHYVRQMEACAGAVLPSTLQCLVTIPSECWLPTFEATWENATFIRALAGQLSQRSMLLAVLIMADCYRSACATMASIEESGKADVSIQSDNTASFRSISVRSKQKLQVDAAEPGPKATRIGSHYDVNESGGYLLWLASNYDNADLLSGLHKLGARIDDRLPLAWSAIHQAIEHNNTNFVQRFLQLYCSVDTNDSIVCKADQAHPPDYVSQMGWVSPSSQDPDTKLRSLDLEDCRRIMCDFGSHAGLSGQPGLLTFACIYGRNDAVGLLLRSYPAWEEFMGTSGLTLFEAAWCDKPQAIRVILQIKHQDDKGGQSEEQLKPSIRHCNREHLYLALLASVHQGHCDVIDALLEAGAASGIPTQVSSVGRARITLLTAKISVSPLHVALDRFRSRDVQVSKRIIVTLQAHGAVLYYPVRDALHEWLGMGNLHDEDCTWLRQVFPTCVDAPSYIAFLPEDGLEVSDSQFLVKGYDSDQAYASDQFSSGSSVSGSTCSFVSATETQGG